MSTYLTQKEAKLAVVLVAFVCAAAFAPLAHADRTSIRLDAGFARPTAAAEGSTGGTGSTNGGNSGGNGVTNANPQEVNVNEEMAQDLLDEFITSDLSPKDFTNDDLGDDAEETVENLDEQPASVSFVTLLHTIISRFRK